MYRDLSLLSTMQANSTYRIKWPDTQFSCNPGKREPGESCLHIIVTQLYLGWSCLRQRPNSEKTKALSGNKINAPKLIFWELILHLLCHYFCSCLHTKTQTSGPWKIQTLWVYWKLRPLKNSDPPGVSKTQTL